MYPEAYDISLVRTGSSDRQWDWLLRPGDAVTISGDASAAGAAASAAGPPLASRRRLNFYDKASQEIAAAKRVTPRARAEEGSSGGAPAVDPSVPSPARTRKRVAMMEARLRDLVALHHQVCCGCTRCWCFESRGPSPYRGLLLDECGRCASRSL